jgi:hypothetical protein
MEQSPVVVYVREPTAGEAAQGDHAFYDPGTRNIAFSPRKAVEALPGQIDAHSASSSMSPAGALVHEAGHALEHATNPAGLNLTQVPVWDNVEERRNIQNVENPAAKRLGEVIRTGHGGTWKNVSCVTCK